MTCRGICKRVPVKKQGRVNYSVTRNWCRTCGTYVDPSGTGYCPCCNCKTRRRPRIKANRQRYDLYKEREKK